jgi:hypothetical protein
VVTFLEKVLASRDEVCYDLHMTLDEAAAICLGAVYSQLEQLGVGEGAQGRVIARLGEMIEAGDYVE